MTTSAARPATGSHQTAPPSDAPASARRWWVLVIVGLAQLVVVLDGTIVNIALPQAQAELGRLQSDGARADARAAQALEAAAARIEALTAALG